MAYENGKSKPTSVGTPSAAHSASQPTVSLSVVAALQAGDPEVSRWSLDDAADDGPSLR